MPNPESVIQSDPDVLGGIPVFAGTRVPVKNLLDYLAAGEDLRHCPRCSNPLCQDIRVCLHHRTLVNTI